MAGGDAAGDADKREGIGAEIAARVTVGRSPVESDSTTPAKLALRPYAERGCGPMFETPGNRVEERQCKVELFGNQHDIRIDDKRPRLRIRKRMVRMVVRVAVIRAVIYGLIRLRRCRLVICSFWRCRAYGRLFFRRRARL